MTSVCEKYIRGENGTEDKTNIRYVYVRRYRAPRYVLHYAWCCALCVVPYALYIYVDEKTTQITYLT